MAIDNIKNNHLLNDDLEITHLSILEESNQEIEENEKVFILDEELNEFFEPFQNQSHSALSELIQKLNDQDNQNKKELEKIDPSNIERRAAIDVGSGGTKIAIADVDRTNNKIVNLLLEKSFPVPYQTALEKSKDGNFDESIKILGLKTFQEIKDLTSNYQVNKISAVATAAFRLANNGESFAKEINEKIGIKLNIISQQEEGNLAFVSALAVVNDQHPENIVVWDIGTGSLQLTTLLENQDLTVFKGNLGSVPFRNYIIDVIQGKNSNENQSPNPMTLEDYKMASQYARALARKAFPVIKDKIQAENMVIGLGRLFYSSVAPVAGDIDKITRKGLRHFIYESLNKTDDELNDPFDSVNVSNCILVLAFMKALHIHEITVVDTTTSKGLLVYNKYW